MKQLSLIFTLLTALIVATNTHAHTGLESSVPSNNTMLMESLEEIELHFASEVNLIKLELVDRANGESVSLGFKPTTAAATDFSQPLPALKIGTYQVNWAAMGADGHKMEGDCSFRMHVESEAGAMMHPDSDEMHGAEASEGESSHSGH